MSSLGRRLDYLERALMPDHGDLYPRWEALGILLLERGYQMLRYAAHLYESGDHGELRQLWIDLAAANPGYTQPDGLQLDWALGALARILPEWKSSGWWEDETLRLFEPDIWLGELRRRMDELIDSGDLTMTEQMRFTPGRCEPYMVTRPWAQGAGQDLAFELIHLIDRYEASTGEPGPQTLEDLATFLYKGVELCQ